MFLKLLNKFIHKNLTTTWTLLYGKYLSHLLHSALTYNDILDINKRNLVIIQKKIPFIIGLPFTSTIENALITNKLRFIYKMYLKYRKL
jgi:hypothetical protein